MAPRRAVSREDPGIYLAQALAHPWHLLQSYAGYLQLVLRLIGQIAVLAGDRLPPAGVWPGDPPR